LGYRREVGRPASSSASPMHKDLGVDLRGLQENHEPENMIFFPVKACKRKFIKT
jgi:hypothetical protein